jgi:hypothetical protein
LPIIHSARKNAASTNFYDCRFNFVPENGGAEQNWTTFTFDADTPGRACGNGDCSSTCAGTTWGVGTQHSLNEYITQVPGAVLSSVYRQVWSISMGDTSGGDAGLQGCYGDIRFTLANTTNVFKFKALKPAR